MTAATYLDFDLQITPATNSATGEHYTTRLLDSPVGQASAPFTLPFSPDELAAFVQQLLQPSNRQSALFEKGMLQAFGRQLYDALFQGEVLTALARSLDEAQRQNASLRLNLRLQAAPALLNLPWEYLYYPTGNRFLALSAQTPLLHFLELPQPLPSLTVQPPLTILALLASPSDLPKLDDAREWANLQSALAPLIEKKLVKLERLEQVTLPALQAALRRTTTHVLHFVGHGLFDEASKSGQLALCNDQGAAELVDAMRLGQLLHNENSLRLVLLNACEGARATLDDPYTGVAQALVQQGVPAVIAMQFAISDQAAITFSQEFYAALADGYGVDTAATEARVAMRTRLKGGEWGAPRLFMRAKDGRLWTLASEQQSIPLPPPPLSQSTGDRSTSLSALLQQPAVRTKIIEFRTDFEAAGQQIQQLALYKELHDLLHKLQFQCYNVMVQEATHFPQDERSLTNLLTYEVNLQNIVGGLHELAQRGNQNGMLPLTEISWFADVEQAQAKLHQALDKSDVDALKRTLWLLKRVLALQPSGVNQRLNAAARALRLPQIIEAIVLIRDALTQPQRNAAQPSTPLEIDVEGLRGLSVRLTRLVDAHDNWQAVERMLGRVEEVMLYDPGELELSWEDLQLRMKPLCPDETLDWVKTLREDSTNITNALSEKNPAKARRYFQRFRQRAGNQFYQVDSELRNLCDDLRQFGEPLASVLKILG